LSFSNSFLKENELKLSNKIQKLKTNIISKIDSKDKIGKKIQNKRLIIK